MNLKCAFAIIVCLGLMSCANKFEKVLKSKDFEYKFQKANEYYDKKQFSRANQLYEELLPVFKGTKRFESTYYKYAYTFYNQGSYLAASYHFKNFTDIFPKSNFTEECEYMNSLCLYKLSPEYTLDQTNTTKAISEMQNYINLHPESKKVDEVNKLVDNARQKLEEKETYGADLYYKIYEYRAAAVSYEQILHKFPDSPNAEYYRYMIIKARYNFAKRSIPEKQKERYEQTISDYKEFINNYAKSKYRNEVEKYYSLSLQSLKKLNTP